MTRREGAWRFKVVDLRFGIVRDRCRVGEARP